MVGSKDEVVAAEISRCVAGWREEGACLPTTQYNILIDAKTTQVAVAVAEKAHDADLRAAGYLGPDVSMAAAVVAPARWDKSVAIHYAIHRVSSTGRSRFPASGFIDGSACDMARLIWSLTHHNNMPGTEEEVTALIRQAADHIPESRGLIPHDSSGLATRMTTAVLWLDALLVLRCRGSAGYVDADTMVSEWRRMATKGEIPAFWPAVEELERVSGSVKEAIALLQRASDIIHASPGGRPTVGAELLPRLSADRQTAAEYYTRNTIAELLAGLVISEDAVADWSDSAIFQEHRLADLACGTGTLLRAGLERICMLHESHGGTASTAARLYRDAVRSGVVGVDVHPVTAYMAASSLVVMQQGWDGETAIGWMGVGGPKGYTGSMELAAADHIHDPDMSGRVAAGPAAHRPVTIPDNSCDWIIMNPPYSRTRIGRAAFDIVGLSAADRGRCQKRWGDLLRGEPARKTAGMAATYIMIAGKKIKPGGRIGFVLPISAASVEAWSDTRRYIEHNFTDILAVSASGHNESLSEDTGIGEMLLVATKLQEPHDSASSIYCATIHEHPARRGEAGEMARAVASALDTIKDSGSETTDVTVGSGAGHIYRLVSDGRGSPWSPLGVVSVQLARSAIHASEGAFCYMDGRSVRFAVGMSPMREVFRIGPTHHIIGHRPGNLPLGVFEIVEGHGPDMFMWTASSKRQSGLIMEPTHTGRAVGDEDGLRKVRMQSSTLFYTRRIGWNGQRLLAAVTRTAVMGGNAWTALIHADARVLRAAALWFNSTLGLLVHWTQGQRTQRGRSNTEMNALKEIPCPRFAELGGAVLDAASASFVRLSEQTLLPAVRAYEDPIRQEIDAAVADMMGLPARALSDIDEIRNLFCNEPTINTRRDGRSSALSKNR